jgi:MFS family permease
VTPAVLAFAIASLAATLVAAIVTAAGGAAQNWARRLFLVVINLNPWILGTWRDKFSRRETFLATWFLTFVATLLLCVFVPRHRVH